MIIVNEIFRLKKIIRRYYRERKQTLIGEPAAELREMPASDIGRVLRKEMRRFRVPGMAAAIFSRQRVVWSLAIGYADLLRGRPMSVDTVFRVASILSLIHI
ncbi:MAG: beta-lactamase family protein, partial [Negativicutes bacterium]|nr:beta-lactamase family protein [Negativicutes bacterium]